MERAAVDVLAPPDRPAAISTLTLAFSTDPVMRWFWPSAATYLATFPSFAELLTAAAFERNTAYALGGRAVALWIPPPRLPDDDALATLMVSSVAPELLQDLAAFADQIGEAHPTEQHWYLPFTGVDPTAQGLGLGSSLLRHALAECDTAGLPAYLEASTLRSRRLYERWGFEPLGVVQAGSSPPVWPMRREPHAGQNLLEPSPPGPGRS